MQRRIRHGEHLPHVGDRLDLTAQPGNHRGKEQQTELAMLERDVRSITDTLGRFAPDLLVTQYAAQMWALFEQGELKPDSRLSGIFIKDETSADLGDVILAIDDARDEAVRRQRGRDEAQLSGEN